MSSYQSPNICGIKRSPPVYVLGNSSQGCGPNMFETCWITVPPSGDTVLICIISSMPVLNYGVPSYVLLLAQDREMRE